jgi:hypothetical protein
MLIVGLGEAGKNIAKLFKPHTKTYKILTFDEGEGLDPQVNVESYDEHPIKITSRGLKSHSEGLLFVCGSGKVAGATLRLLEALQAHKMTVVYLVPDLEFASREEIKRHRAHFGILQEYTRSGKIKEMVVLSNKMLLDHVGPGAIRKYYEKVNYHIYSIFQNLNFCQNVDQDFGKLHNPKEISRISTIGWSQMHGDEELLFPLENITESCYYMNIDESDLDSDEDLLPTCQQIVRENNNLERHSSFAIWTNSETENHYYVKHYTHHIQEIK